jgi:DNA-binding IclR family transcriptional regulator
VTSRFTYEAAEAGRRGGALSKDKRKAAPRKYSAPALEKGLDILEFLANQGAPQSARRIAEHLGRSKSEIFRMVAVLLGRGYLARNDATEELLLTDRLFEMGIRTPRARELLDVAVPIMRQLATEIGQSSHLVVLSRGETVVIAAISGGSDMSFTLRLGYRRPITTASSGRVILAFQRPEVAERWIAQSRKLVGPDFDDAELKDALKRIRQEGYEIHPSRDVVGITDVACPIRDASGEAVAALVMPFVNRVSRDSSLDAVLQAVQQAAKAISTALFGNGTGAAKTA